MDPSDIYNVLKAGTPADRKHLLSQLPDIKSKAIAMPLIVSNHPSAVVMGMCQMIMECCNGAEPEIGAILAQVTHQIAKENYDEGNSELIPTTLSNLACQHVKALNLIGRSEEAIKYCRQYIPFYKSIHESENLSTLQLAEIQALLNMDQIDDADEKITDPTLKPNWANQIEYDRLKNRIEEMKQLIYGTQRSIHREDVPEMENSSMMAALKSMIRQSIPGSEGEAILSLANKLDPNNRLDPHTSDGYGRLMQILEQGETILTGASKSNSELTIRRQIREAESIFMRSAEPTPDIIQTSLAVLEKCLLNAREHNLRELVNQALWGIYLCHSRMSAPSLAANALIELRHHLERTRINIANPTERGGVFKPYPNLFPALVEKLHQSGRIEEMLEAIEASKGRGVADILTQKSSAVVADIDIYKTVRMIPQLTQRYKFHFLSWFVDTSCTYAVLVTKQGRLISLDPIPIGMSGFQNYAINVDPRLWGAPDEIDASQRIADTSKALSVLIQWMEELLAEGILEKGDHLCYSPDAQLANIPAHYLHFGGTRLIDFFSISRIHNSFHLYKVLQTDPRIPDHSLSLIVPALQDLKHSKWEQMKKNLHLPCDYLHQLGLMGPVLKNTDARPEAISKNIRTGTLINFSTHGIFPQNQVDKNPFYHSGLIMSDGGSLPDKNAISKGSLDGVLTPNLIFDLNMRFDDCHISMMSCASGLSREGIGGDALGLDWAFIQGGACSLLSSHWYVSAAQASRFLNSFYQLWLEQGLSRGKALQSAIKKEKMLDESPDAMAGWAAFSLTGDWR
jgi:CHAT domain-containing protein